MKNKIIISTFLFLAGCSTWQNFTTYFNTYYNAEKAFDDAMELVQKDKKELFQFKVDRLSNNEKKLFNAVVEKCSKILQFNSKSSYVPGSLFLLGQTFYYQQDFTKAARKFKELGLLNDDKYALKNLLWTGKTELQLRNFDYGIEVLDSAKFKALNEEDEYIQIEAYKAQISFFIFHEEYENAVELLHEMVDASTDEELNAEALYELGKIYLEMDSLSSAANAFLAVNNYSPNFETEFNSRLEYATIKRELGDVDESLEILQDMESQNKFIKKRDQIELQIANIFRDKGNLDNAINLYMEIDSVYQKSESAGYARYNIAKILQDSLKLFDSSMVFYRKTLNSTLPRDFKMKVQQESILVNKYIQITKERKKFELQLLYATNPDIFIQDSLDYAFYSGQDTSLAIFQNTSDSNGVNTQAAGRDFAGTNRSQSELLKPYQAANKIKLSKPIRPTISADSINHGLSGIRYAIGNLFLGELDVPDSAYYYYNKVLTEDKFGPYTAKTLFAMGTYYSSMNDTTKADSLFKLVYDNYKDELIAVEAARRLGREEISSESDITKKMYVDAENQYMNGNYNEAISIFYDIAKKYPRSSMAPKSLYAIGWLLENRFNQPDSAYNVYNSLKKNYNRSEFTLAVTRVIDAYDKEKQRINKAVRDSIAIAKRDSIADATKNSMKNLRLKEAEEFQKSKKQKNKINKSIDIENTPKDSVRSNAKILNKPGSKKADPKKIDEKPLKPVRK